MKVDIRVPVGRPVQETADFIAGCEAAGFAGVGVHDYQHSGRDVFVALALAAERWSSASSSIASRPRRPPNWTCIYRGQLRHPQDSADPELVGQAPAFPVALHSHPEIGRIVKRLGNHRLSQPRARSHRRR